MARRRSDPNYRKLWLGDWRVVLAAAGTQAGKEVELIVVTAPGADRLPWDRSKCSHGPEVKCTGPAGCVVVDAAADAWNRAAPANWSRLHRAAAIVTRRRHGSFRVAFRVWEPQKRGALHMNVVVPVGTARERASAATYRAELARLAPMYGFGNVDRKRAVREAMHAARYLAKYLSEESGKSGIGDLVERGDCPVVIARVNPALTRATGVTMRSRRYARGLWLLARDQGCDLEEAKRIRLVTSKRSRARWARSTASGRSQLPWDAQAGLATWERQARDAIAELLGDADTVIWPIPPRRPVHGVDY